MEIYNTLIQNYSLKLVETFIRSIFSKEALTLIITSWYPIQCTRIFSIIRFSLCFIFCLNMNLIIIVVRTRFESNHNRVGFARKKAHTISFVERGFERLGPDHQAVGFSWCSLMVESSSPLESFSWRWAGRLWFLAIFLSPLFGVTPFFLI